MKPIERNPSARVERDLRAPEPRMIPSADPLAGTAYRTIALLGQGAMGIVVEAEHIALRARVVVKLLHEQLADRADLVDRMRLEAQALGALTALRHPNIVAVTDFAVTPRGVPFLVMERLFGRTVAEERRCRGVLPIHEAIDIARQTLAGLAAVHKAGFVHRDIKAANLLLCGGAGRPTVKLLDFGIAKVLSSHAGCPAPRPLRFPTAEGVTVGTPRYLSPEQASSQPVDARADLYAVGALLYYLVTGRGPFDELQDYAEMINAHALLVPLPPSARTAQPIPPELDAVIMRALSKRPPDRFATAEEFAAALLHIPCIPGATRRPVQRRFDTEPLPPPPSSSPVPLVTSPSVDADDAEPTVLSARAPVSRRIVLAVVGALGWALVVSLVLRIWIFR